MLDLKIDALRSLYKAEIAMYTAEVKNYIQNPTQLIQISKAYTEPQVLLHTEVKV